MSAATAQPISQPAGNEVNSNSFKDKVSRLYYFYYLYLTG